MQDNSIGLKQVLQMLRKHWKGIVTFLLAGIVISAAFTFLIVTPKYESSSMILVNQKSTGDPSNQLNEVQTDLQMINTYKDIITEPVIMNQVAKNLQQDGYSGVSASSLASAITLTNNQNSQVINVTARSNNPYFSEAIANEVTSVFSKKVTKIMENAKNVSIVSKATANFNAVSPRPALNLLVGALLGLIAGIGFAFIRTFTDKKVRDTAFISETLEIPLLGTITEINQKSMRLGTAQSQTAAGIELSRSRSKRFGGTHA